ncbi:MAG: hypothetical protein FWE71_01850 [Nocardioidaceae bacterium]|nr:hypothetical protein [Nocardioidaceae bacterium]MCL2613842.1 hypothetical protein [Nocardioidaceae bacterium]
MTGGLLHAITGAFSTLLGWLFDMVPSVPGWVTGAAPLVQSTFGKAAGLETWIPITEAVGVAQDVCAIWATAAMISFARQAYSAITNRNA